MVTLPEHGEVEVSISREEFNNITSGLIEQTGDLCRAVSLLVGGSTRMPQVKRFLTDIFHKEPISHVNPDEAVALGAVIQATKPDPAYATLSISTKKDGTKVASSLVAIGTLSKDVKGWVNCKNKRKISTIPLEVSFEWYLSRNLSPFAKKNTLYINIDSTKSGHKMDKRISMVLCAHNTVFLPSYDHKDAIEVIKITEKTLYEPVYKLSFQVELDSKFRNKFLNDWNLSLFNLDGDYKDRISRKN
jgi:hypothetical protein